MSKSYVFIYFPQSRIGFEADLGLHSGAVGNDPVTTEDADTDCRALHRDSDGSGSLDAGIPGICGCQDKGVDDASLHQEKRGS